MDDTGFVGLRSSFVLTFPVAIIDLEAPCFEIVERPMIAFDVLKLVLDSSR